MNKPVAWIKQSKYGTPALVWNGEPIKYNAISAQQSDIPLYIHPVKELTDEEIMDIKTLMEINYGCVSPLEFAWALLAKAQEK